VNRQENTDEIFKISMIVLDSNEGPDEDGAEKWVSLDGGVRVVDHKSYAKDDF